MLKTIQLSLSNLSSREKLRFSALLALRVLANLLDVAGVALVGFLVAGLVTGEDLQLGQIRVSLDTFQDEVLIALFGIVGLVFLSRSAIAVLSLRLISLFLSRVEARLALVLARFFLDSGLETARTITRAEYQWSTGSSMTIAVSVVLTNTAVIVSEGLLLLMMVLFFLLLEPLLAAVFLVIVFALATLFQVFVSPRARDSGRDVSQSGVDAVQATLTIFDSFREIATGGRMEYFLRKYQEARERSAIGLARSRYISSIPRYALEAVVVTGILAIGGWFLVFSSFQESAGLMGVAFFGGLRVVGALVPLQASVTVMQNQAPLAEAALSKLELVARSNQVSAGSPKREGQAREDCPPAARKIVACGVTFTYPDGDEIVLKDVSFSVPSTGLTALVGPSGSGKTTLADIIAGLRSPDSGIFCLGSKTAAKIRAENPGKVAYVPQRPALISASLEENVALGFEDEFIDRGRVIDCLELVGMKRFVENLPKGLGTDVAELGSNLSGGQLQRLGIARALYQRPTLLVLDEATSSLDMASEESLGLVLKNLSQTVAVFAIAHRLSTAKIADTVVVLESGSVTGIGAFADLQISHPLISEYSRIEKLG